MNILKGMIFFAWFAVHTYVTTKFQNDNSTEWKQLCKWKYAGVAFPNKALPDINLPMVGGPEGDYKSYWDAIVLLSFFSIEYYVGRYLVSNSKSEEETQTE